MQLSLKSALGRQRRLNQVGETINSIATPAAAFSLRSLTGGDPLSVRVRRDTGGGAGDDDERDFTVSEVASGALLDFVGSGNNGFVHTWFDQSGNDRHAVQDTDPRQPIIVESGTFQNGLKFTHADTTNGKRLSFDRDTSQLGTEFAFVWVGTYSGSSSTPKNLLGASRLVQGFNSGSMGLVVRPSVENFRFRNEKSSTTHQQIVSTQTMSADTLGVVFANYDDDAVTISLNGTANTATFSSTVLNSTKNFHIMSVTPYATANSPEGICREALVYDTNQVNNRTSIETNIINHYSIS